MELNYTLVAGQQDICWLGKRQQPAWGDGEDVRAVARRQGEGPCGTVVCPARAGVGGWLCSVYAAFHHPPCGNDMGNFVEILDKRICGGSRATFRGGWDTHWL